MRVVPGAASDIGLVREGNEDSFVTDEPLFGVADGMGGHRGGEVASRLALETLEALFKRGRGSLAEQVVEANRAVFERSLLDRAVAGMGTTLTVAAVEPGRVRLVHVGDSRAYLLRGGDLKLLTEDHTLVHDMVKRGEITEHEAELHPHRSVLTRALGTEPDVQVDELVAEVRGGDRLLLCTDGLNGMVPDEQIRAILQARSDPQTVAETLVRAANDAGGIDNTTAVVIDFVEEAGEADPPPAAPTNKTEVRAVPRPAAGPPSAPRAGTKREPRVRWRRLLAWVAGIAIAATLALTGIRMYLDAQWYVGVSHGRVAVFRGVPTDVAGFRLHSLVEETDIPTANAQALAFYGDLPQGITADSREEADAIVEQIRTDIATAEGRDQAA